MSAPLILGFDTSGPACAAALLRGNERLAVAEEAMATGQAERLMPMLEALLAGAGLGWRDLSGLGVGTGPGNFTGVRIAVAAARGLALALQRPAIGVSTLEARALGLPSPVAVVEPARRGQLCLGLPGAAPELTDPTALPARIGALPVTGSAATEAAAVTGSAVLPPAMPLAEAIARIAAARLAAGGQHPRPAPVYLRPADAAPPSEAPPVLLP